MRRGQSSLERAFLFHWRNLAPGAPEPEPEYRFAAMLVGPGHGVRSRLHDAGLQDWRFDYAWPDRMVAVECEGGTWTRGRHVRGQGFEDDCWKYSTAAALGWAVLRFTRGMLCDDPQACVNLVLEAMK